MNTTTPPDYMTGAELQTLREACHLSREELADLAGVQARTVKHWENGRAAVPADVADVARGMDAAIQQAAAHELAQVQQGQHPSTAHGAACVLLRYKDNTDAKGLDGWTPTPCAASASAAIVARVLAGARWHSLQQGKPAPVLRVVWFDAAEFEEWRRLQGLEGLRDSHPLRQRWAGHAIAKQAIPHRLDQPPA